MNAGTYTRSSSNTFTEARAKYVLGKIFDDFNGILFRGFKNQDDEKTIKWRDDVQFILENNALEHFELHFKTATQTWALRYEVDQYGGIYRDDNSGGIDFFNIPDSAYISIIVKHDNSNETVNEYLRRRGWVSGGNFIAASAINDRSYSKNGFGVNRKKFGDF